MPTLTANVTNQIAVLPGYVGGSLAYREELRGQRSRATALGVTSALGAAVGAVLLVISSQRLFAHLAPVLVLAAVALLAAQPHLSRVVAERSTSAHAREEPGPGLHAANFAASVYGGYFGAGLGIMLLALLAVGLEDALQRLNALKGLLSLVVAIVAALFFAVFGPVRWEAAAVMAVGAFLGGQVGVSFARRIPDQALRWGIVVLGTAVAVWLLVRL